MHSVSQGTSGNRGVAYEHAPHAPPSHVWVTSAHEGSPGVHDRVSPSRQPVSPPAPAEPLPPFAMVAPVPVAVPPPMPEPVARDSSSAPHAATATAMALA